MGAVRTVAVHAHPCDEAVPKSVCCPAGNFRIGDDFSQKMETMAGNVEISTKKNFEASRARQTVATIEISTFWRDAGRTFVRDG